MYEDLSPTFNIFNGFCSGAKYLFHVANVAKLRNIVEIIN